jgi:hypothetical protein
MTTGVKLYFYPSMYCASFCSAIQSEDVGRLVFETSREIEPEKAAKREFASDTWPHAMTRSLASPSDVEVAEIFDTRIDIQVH